MRLIIGFVVGVIHTLMIVAAAIGGASLVCWSVANDEYYYKSVCNDWKDK